MLSPFQNARKGNKKGGPLGTDEGGGGFSLKAAPPPGLFSVRLPYLGISSIFTPLGTVSPSRLFACRISLTGMAYRLPMSQRASPSDG